MKTFVWSDEYDTGSSLIDTQQKANGFALNVRLWRSATDSGDALASGSDEWKAC